MRLILVYNVYDVKLEEKVNRQVRLERGEREGIEVELLDSLSLTLDPEGRFVASPVNDSSFSIPVLELSSGMVTNILPCMPLAMGPAARLYAVWGYHGAPGCAVFEERAHTPFITLRPDDSSSSEPCIDLTGNLVAWGKVGGTVRVCDLKMIHGRLKNVGLQW